MPPGAEWKVTLPYISSFQPRDAQMTLWSFVLTGLSSGWVQVLRLCMSVKGGLGGARNLSSTQRGSKGGFLNEQRKQPIM